MCMHPRADSSLRNRYRRRAEIAVTDEVSSILLCTFIVRRFVGRRRTTLKSARLHAIRLNIGTIYRRWRAGRLTVVILVIGIVLTGIAGSGIVGATSHRTPETAV